MKLYIVQGEHPYVPGRPMTAHATKQDALNEAIKLANLIVTDANKTRDKQLPLVADFADEAVIDAAMKAVGDNADVCITETMLRHPERDPFRALIDTIACMHATGDRRDIEGEKIVHEQDDGDCRETVDDLIFAARAITIARPDDLIEDETPAGACARVDRGQAVGA